MSIRDLYSRNAAWISVALFGLVALVLVWITATKQAYVDTRAHIAAERAAERTDDEIFAACEIHVDVSARRRCILEGIEAKRENRRSDYDLVAQEAVANWSTLTGLAAAAGLVTSSFTIWGVFLVWQTLAVSRDAMMRQLRAYVGIQKIEIRLPGDEYVPNVLITYRNNGQTPAYRIRHNCTYEILMIGEPRHPKAPTTSERGLELGREQTLTKVMLIDSPFMSDVIVGNFEIYVQGEITYLDAFKNERYTRYRSRLVGGDRSIEDASFVMCSEGNESN